MTSPLTSVEALLENSLWKIGIPPRPIILDHIHAEMQKEEPNFNHLVQIISSDVALSASLINITNSPFFGFHSRVNTPGQALMLLGLNTASRAIAGIVMRRSFPASPHIERFWDASAHIARLSGWLAQQLTHGSLHADEAYTFGLFRDCGIPILLSRFPNYFEILNEANHDAVRCFTTIEELILPTNHAVIGYVLAQSWWLDDETILAIRQHHDIDTLNTASIPPSLNTRYRIALSQLAEHLLQQHTGRSITQEWEKLGPACMRLLNLSDDDLVSLLKEARPVIEAEE